MIANDVLRSMRYMLRLSEPDVLALFRLAEHKASPAEIGAWLKKDDEEGFTHCPSTALSRFLDGLVIQRRGRQDGVPLPPPEPAIDNNTILKKLRIAFILKEEDVLQLVGATGFKISQSEINALFRKKGHANYRECGDQLLRYFLKGLTLRLRPPAQTPALSAQTPASSAPARVPVRRTPKLKP